MEAFSKLISEKDTAGQKLLLEKWEKEDGDDAELFVAYFNYYVVKSKNNMVTLGHDPKGKDALQIMDQDTNQTEPVGYLYDHTFYDPELVNEGFAWINRGIAKHPDRLDMRFGKIYMLGTLEDYVSFTEEIIKTLDYSTLNQNEWIWSENEPLEDPKEFMLGSIQSYQVQLYVTEDEELLNNMQAIAETVLKYYPDHIESLSNLSIVYMIREEYDKAVESLLKAEELNPKDTIILSNAAHAYRLLGDTANAIKYYEKTIEYGDENAKNFAQGQIDQIRAE